MPKSTTPLLAVFLFFPLKASISSCSLLSATKTYDPLFPPYFLEYLCLVRRLPLFCRFLPSVFGRELQSALLQTPEGSRLALALRTDLRRIKVCLSQLL